MKSDMATTTSRTVTISRLVLAFAVAFFLGAMVVPSVDATKNTKNTVASVKKRVQGQLDVCEIGGGTLVVKKTAFGSTITKCNGGTEDGLTCVNTKKGTTCHRTRTVPPESGPAVPPTDGVYEEPTGGGGGNNAGGGAAAPPGESVKDPNDPPGGGPVIQ